MTITTGLFTSNSEEWETPQDLFDKYNRLFGFQLDVCATKFNAKCKNFFTKEDNGLSRPWMYRNWMNPPYGRAVGKWCAKAYKEAHDGNLTVALLPARTDTKWFHLYCARWHKVFLQGRLKFKNATGGGGSAPFPSMIVFFGIPAR